MSTQEDDLELRELDAMANTLEAEQAPPQPDGSADEAQQPGVSPEMQAYGMARTLTEILAKGAQMRWECLTYSDKIKDDGAQYIAPVILKYDWQSELYSKYKEEFEMGAFFAGILFTSYKQVKQYEADLKAKAEKEKEGAPSA